MPKTFVKIPTLLKIGSGEISNIGKYLKRSSFDNIACFYSKGIEELFGEKINNSLDEYNIKVLHKDVIDEIDIENIIHTAFKIPKKVDALVGVGGGKALDYSKYCAHVLGLPFISVPTSTSNDGFCSPNSSLLVEKKRKSVTATIPYGVVVDIDIIKSSPDICIFSGIGDLISKITAEHDWLSSARKHKEDFSDFSYLIAQNSVLDILNYKDADYRNEDFLYKLVVSLLMNGLSMEIAGSSRPASGSEHLISHALDSLANEPQMHGIQVGVMTYLCSYLQNNQFETVKSFLTSIGFFDFVAQKPFVKSELIQAIKKAPEMKENFYTILSEENALSRAIAFIESDETMKKLVK